MSISRSVTIAGWVVITLTFTSAWLGAHLSGGRFPTAAAIAHSVMGYLPVRIVALAGWAWIGWHFFVRTSR